jgi:hypothetical protein
VDSREFAVSIVQENHRWAEEHVPEAYARLREPLQREGLVHWVRSLMWREYSVGVHVPAKTLALLDDAHQDLKLLLSTQIADEWKHAQVFSRRAFELGGDGDLAHYEPTAADWEMYRSTYNWDYPEQLAASLNVTGEVWLTLLYQMLTDYRGPRVDPETAQAIRQEVLAEPTYEQGCVIDDRTAALMRADVIPDEGRHVRIGRLVIERVATTPEAQARVRAAVERKRQGLMASHKGLVANALSA